MTASEIILISRRSVANHDYKNYDNGQVVSIKPTGQITILRYGYNMENRKYHMTWRSELFIGAEETLAMVWLAEKYYNKDHSRVLIPPYDGIKGHKMDTWQLVIRYPEGGEERISGLLKGYVKFAGIDLSKYMKMILPGQKLMAFGHTPISLWELECDFTDKLHDLRDLNRDGDYQYYKELSAKLDAWDEEPSTWFEFWGKARKKNKRKKSYLDNWFVD